VPGQISVKLYSRYQRNHPENGNMIGRKTLVTITE